MKKLFLIVFLFYSSLLLGGSMLWQYDILIQPQADDVIMHFWPEPERIYEPPLRDVPIEYREIFAAAAEGAGIPPWALESIAWAESMFDHKARSPVRDDGHRDLGMFQFNTRYLDWYAEQYNAGAPFDPMIPAEATVIAAKHIRFLYERYGQWSDVFLAYNCGYGAVDRNEIPDSSFAYLIKIYEGK